MFFYSGFTEGSGAATEKKSPLWDLPLTHNSPCRGAFRTGTHVTQIWIMISVCTAGYFCNLSASTSINVNHQEHLTSAWSLTLQLQPEQLDINSAMLVLSRYWLPHHAKKLKIVTGLYRDLQATRLPWPLKSPCCTIGCFGTLSPEIVLDRQNTWSQNDRRLQS